MSVIDLAAALEQCLLDLSKTTKERDEARNVARDIAFTHGCTEKIHRFEQKYPWLKEENS